MKRILWIALIVAIVCLNLLPVVSQAQIAELSLPYTVSKVIPAVSFGGEVSYTTISLTFGKDGSLTVKKDVDSITFNTTGATLFKDGNVYRQQFKDYAIIYDLDKYSDRVKITYTGNFKGTITLPISVDAKSVAKVKTTEYKYTVGSLTYDWSDAATSIIYNVASKELQFTTNGSFDIDPTIGTSTFYYNYNSYRRTFYVNSLFWVFYCNGTNYVWRTSADGTTWSAASTMVAGVTDGRNIAMTYDGTYFHYSRAPNNDKLYYRRGTLDAGGNITWSQAEQQVKSSGCSSGSQSTGIAVNTNGYVFIVYSGASYHPQVVKGNTTDGTWVTDTDDEMKAAENADNQIVALTNGKVYVLYSAGSSTKVYGRLWDAGWAAGQTCTTYNVGDTRTWSAVAYGDIITLVYNRDSTTSWRSMTYTGTWGSDTLILATAATEYPALALWTGGDLVLFWANDTGDIVYYMRRTSGTWDAAATAWIDETGDTIESLEEQAISCDFTIRSHMLSFTYATKASSPYNIKHAYLQEIVVPTVTTQAADNISYLSATLHGNVTATGGASPTIRGFKYGKTSGALDLDWHEHGTFIAETFSWATGNTLDDDDTYYFQAYATNSAGTGNGTELTFDTLAYVPPTVGSMSSTVNSGCSVTLLGNVTAIGGLTIDERGFEWGLLPGVYTYEWHEHGSWGVGNFTYTWTSADDDTTYYWRATAVNDGLLRGNGTEENFTSDAVPAPIVVTILPATDIGITTAIAHGNITDYGDPCEHIDIRGFEWGLVSGIYTGNETEVGWFALGTFDLTITGLPFGTLIFYRAHAFNAHLVGYGAEGNFTTILPLPLPPGNLTATQTGVGNITITWDMGLYAEDTIIMIGEDTCPGNITDGYLVYNGNGTTATYSGLSLGMHEYCIRAWSSNDTGNSTTYAEEKIGGDSMTMVGCILIGLLALACMALGFHFRQGAFMFGGVVFWLSFVGYAYLQTLGSGDTFWTLAGAGAIMMAICAVSGFGVFWREAKEPEETALQKYQKSQGSAKTETSAEYRTRMGLKGVRRSSRRLLGNGRDED